MAGELEGAPPRGRGRLRAVREAIAALRSTPAWAGTTERRCSRSCRAAEHPRVGGDDLTEAHVAPELVGAPPRGRGRHLPSWDSSAEVGS